MTRRLRTFLAVELGLAGAFALVAVLVVTGSLTRLDQYGIDHWMARVGTGPPHTSLWDAFRPYPSGGSVLERLFNVWTFPASVVFSGAALVLCCLVLERRGARRAAFAWVSAWVIANAIELAGKGLLHRPGLTALVHGMRQPISGFNSSFPSGHTERGLVLAFMLAALWPRVAWPVGLWAAGTCVLLVVTGDHTPSDIVGGALAVFFVVVAVRFCGKIEAR